MKKFGLIGDPISTSLSPALFKAGYGGRYTYDLIEGPDFEESYRRFTDGYDGINVTAPFKLNAYARADRRSETCAKTGAANLLLKTEDGIYADNTDYAGIVLSVLEAVLGMDGTDILDMYGTDFRKASGAVAKAYGYRPSALVAGCGGAGRAAALAAATTGYDTVLLNRSVDKAEKIASDMPEYSLRTGSIDEFPRHFTECDLLIYTYPELDEIHSQMDTLAYAYSRSYQEFKQKYDEAKSKWIQDRPAPDFTTRDLNGRTVSLSDFRGQYVLLDFWASWCKPCRKRAAELKAIYPELRARGITVCGLSMDEKRKQWAAATREDGIVWTNTGEVKPFKDNAIAAAYHVSQLPTMFLIDPEGIIVMQNPEIDDLLKLPLKK